jgi:hypothetical protein
MRPSTIRFGLAACSLVLVSLLAQGCGGGGGGCSGEGCSSSGLDWYSSSCAELGGTQTAWGNCFIPCEAARDCPVAGLDCRGGGTIWISGYCAPGSALQSTRGCGPGEWYRSFGNCEMACSGAGRDSECPSQFHCVEDSIYDGLYFCTGYQGGSTTCGGSPCPSGCCSITGNVCCGGALCAGGCIGSPCCR